MNIRKGDWMEAASGIRFWPLDPRPEEVNIEDIAHSLSHQCRYAGHCKEFYSVAQHSVLVSQILPPQYKLWGLLHDAAEAYLVDLPRPVKHCSELGSIYQDIEKQLMKTICKRFGLSQNEPEEVRAADEVLLATEKRDIMKSSLAWCLKAEPLETMILQPWTPSKAKKRFLWEFGDLWYAEEQAA